jgi:hypothetical protein
LEGDPGCLSVHGCESASTLSAHGLPLDDPGKPRRSGGGGAGPRRAAPPAYAAARTCPLRARDAIRCYLARVAVISATNGWNVSIVLPVMRSSIA